MQRPVGVLGAPASGLPSAAFSAESLSSRCRIVRAFLIEEQKIVKRVLKLQQRKAK